MGQNSRHQYIYIYIYVYIYVINYDRLFIDMDKVSHVIHSHDYKRKTEIAMNDIPLIYKCAFIFLGGMDQISHVIHTKKSCYTYE